MKLGIINGWQEGHFKAVHDKGLEAVEFCINGKYDSAEVLAIKEEIKANSEKYNVAVGSIGRWGMCRLDECGNFIPEALQHDKNLIDLASFVGCPVYNVGINRIEAISYYENCEKAVEYLSVLIDYAKTKNVKIAVYNCGWDNFVYEEKAWAYILGRLPELGIKYDCSHCCNRNGDYIKEIRDWGSRFYHFHLKGVLRCEADGIDDPPAGLDMINWRAVMALLYINNYDGMLSIEPHSRNWKGGRGQWGIDYTINYFRPMIMPDSYNSIEEDPFMP